MKHFCHPLHLARQGQDMASKIISFERKKGADMLLLSKNVGHPITDLHRCFYNVNKHSKRGHFFPSIQKKNLFMFCLKVFLFLFGIFPQNFAADNAITRYSKYGNKECSDMTATHGYGYTKFFHITQSETKNQNHEFVLKFTVMAKSDAHILLTPAASPQMSDPVYEIVLGAGRNSFSDIRRSQRAASKSTIPTPGLLSTNETRAFWVRLTKDGVLGIGKWGQENPFLFWQDPDPLPIQYFSFATWSNVWGTWRYNCVDNVTAEETIEEVIRPLSMHEKLRKDLLTDYDPYARPAMSASQRTRVFMELSTHRIAIDDKRGVLLVDGILKMQWADEKLMWHHEDYENLTQLHIEHHEIWQPEIVLYNAASSHGADILGEAALTVDFDGVVTWNPTTQMDAWCDVDLTHWPNDQQICQIQLGVWSQDQLLELSLMANKNGDAEPRTGSEWELVYTISETTWTKTPWMNLEPVSGTTVPFSAITLQYTLKRKSQAIHRLLVSPLFFFGILTIIPFWMSPYSTGKLTVQSVNILLLSMFLIGVGMALPAPADQLPNIVLAYVLGMLLVIFSILISILGICLVRYRPMMAPPLIIRKLLTARLSRKLLFLPKVNHKKSGFFQEVSCDATRCMTPEETAQHWFIAVKAVDRVMCLANSILWAIILAYQN